MHKCHLFYHSQDISKLLSHLLLILEHLQRSLIRIGDNYILHNTPEFLPFNEVSHIQDICSSFSRIKSITAHASSYALRGDVILITFQKTIKCYKGISYYGLPSHPASQASNPYTPPKRKNIESSKDTWNQVQLIKTSSTMNPRSASQFVHIF